jgi:hypothetical protein
MRNKHTPAGRWIPWLAGFLLLLTASTWAGDAAAFDLIGPRVEVTVTRSGRTLPIAEVPNLLAGDRVWIHPVLPDTQSARYLMVVAFLRGATNPPPDSWFIRAETWTRVVHEEGVVVTVPAGAQQALVFLAPQTGGDFATLRSAVQGKPGAFVRAAQDLQLASLHRARLEKYLAAIRESDPKQLHERALTLARSLSIRVDEQCFSHPELQQASCLMQNSDQLVLDDGHGDSVVTALTQGAGSDLLGAISTTKAAGGGAYSPYVGVFVDLARLMENLHTARYQYISALALPQADELHLRLNYPPSFHKPQSVIVIGLPAVQPAVPPTLKPVSAETASCAQNPKLVLAAEGAPLVFSSELAHDLFMRLEGKDGKSVDVPVVANALQGGFVASAPMPPLSGLPLTFNAVIHGEWGFDKFDGPTYRMERTAASVLWALAEEDRTTVVAGKDRTVHLHGESTACLQEMSFRDAAGEDRKSAWKAFASGLEVQLPTEHAPAGESALLIKQYGLEKPSELPLRVYEEACTLDGFDVRAGDTDGVLRGKCVGKVDWLEADGVRWQRSGAASGERMTLSALQAEKLALHEKQSLAVHVHLKDGRTLDLSASVLAARPTLQLVSKKIEAADSPIHLRSEDDLPVDGRLQFRVKSETPFNKGEKVEVASIDGFYHAELSLENGGLMRQNAHTVVANLELGKEAAASSFGALRFRPLSGDGAAGDWQPLATLVRLPEIVELRCPPGKKEDTCALIGSNLFLIDSIAAGEDFESPTAVSENAMDGKIDVPRPKGKLLYLKLRDDPSAIHTLEPPMHKDVPPSQASRKEPVHAREDDPAPKPASDATEAKKQ